MRINKSVLDQIREIVGTDYVLEEEPMKRHTSMEVGGPASCFIRPASGEEAAAVLRILKNEAIPYYVIGNGSNLIVRDEGFQGAIMEMMRLSEITADGRCVTAQCGAMLKDIARFAADRSLSGFEFASGIPGSLGGAVTMNAGAYDGEMKDIISSVTLLDANGKQVTKTCEEMDFSYRHSICSESEYLVLSATFLLEDGNKAEIEEKMEDLSRRRKEKQPLEYPSCGSTFKRPEGYFAGKLITDAGLKGYRLGGAQVSEKHAGFVINRDRASAADVLALIEHVQKTVKDQFGVELKCEVKII